MAKKLSQTTTFDGSVTLNGPVTLGGAITASNNRIENVGAAVGASDAINVNYFNTWRPYTFFRTTNFTNATTTMNNVIQSGQLEVGTYQVDMFLMIKSSVATTPTLNFDLNASAGSLTWAGMADWYTTATAVNSSAYISSAATVISVAPSTSERIFRYSGRMVLSGATAFVRVRMGMSAATATGTIMTGSSMTVARIS